MLNTFYIADHLILLKDICIDPEVVQDFALGDLNAQMYSCIYKI